MSVKYGSVLDFTDEQTNDPEWSGLFYSVEYRYHQAVMERAVKRWPQATINLSKMVMVFPSGAKIFFSYGDTRRLTGMEFRDAIVDPKAIHATFTYIASRVRPSA